MYLKNSQARRLLPIPAKPMIETRCAVPVVGGAVEGLLDEAQLAVTAHERRFQSLGLERPTCAGDDPQRAEEREQALFALKLVRAGVLVGDRLLGGAPGGRPRRRTLPGGAVDWIREAVLTTSPATIPSPSAPIVTAASPVRTPARARRLSAPISSPRAETAADQVERGADGALGVVFGCNRGAPHGHHRVADELLDRAAVQLDQAAAGVEVAGEELTRFPPRRASRRRR